MLPSNYLQLPIDLSGSMSKNRFRWEMLWGIYQIFEIYDNTDDFTVIFDCVCDVEIYTDAGDSYYQVKTKKQTQPYTVRSLCKTSKATDGAALPSILGKLYLIKAASDPRRSVKLAVVSNVGLSYNRTEYTDKMEMPLLEIDDDAQDEIRQALSAESGHPNIDLNKIYYLRSYMDLANPQESVIGKMVTWFADNRGCEIKNPKALYNSLSDIVKEKASYEWNGADVCDLEKRKGLSKQQFDRLLLLHNQNAIDGIESSKKWITDNIPVFVERINTLKDLSTIVQYLPSDERLHQAIECIENVINSNQIPQGLNTTQVIDYLQKSVQHQTLPDYTDGQIRMLALVTIMRLEEVACQP